VSVAAKKQKTNIFQRFSRRVLEEGGKRPLAGRTNEKKRGKLKKRYMKSEKRSEKNASINFSSLFLLDVVVVVVIVGKYYALLLLLLSSFQAH